MKRLSIAWLIGLLTFGGLVQTAAAGVCVKINKEKDTLSEQERKSVRVTLENKLNKHGFEVVEKDCSDTYTAYNVKLGDAVVAHLSNSKRSKELKAQKMGDLNETYDQLVRAVALGQKKAMTRDNVTKEQSDPERVQADQLALIGIGMGAISGDELYSGAKIEGGYRYELDSWAIKFNYYGIFETNTPESRQSANTLALDVGMDYYLFPNKDQSPFVGGSLGLGRTTIPKQNPDSDMFSTGRSGGGLHVNASVGYEFLRTSNISFITKLTGAFPTYEVGENDKDQKDVYSPSVALSVVIGYTPWWAWDD